MFTSWEGQCFIFMVRTLCVGLAAQQNDLITLGSSYNGISQIISFPLYLLDEDTPFTILLYIHAFVCRRWFLGEDKSSSQDHRGNNYHMTIRGKKHLIRTLRSEDISADLY